MNNSTRDEILRFIKDASRRGYGITNGSIAGEFNLAKSTVSYHLNCLENDGHIFRYQGEVLLVSKKSLLDLALNRPVLTSPVQWPKRDPQYIIMDIKNDPEAKKLYASIQRRRK